MTANVDHHGGTASATAAIAATTQKVKSGTALRIVTSLVAAGVVAADGIFHWHLSTAEVLGIVTPLVGLVIAEGHAEAGKWSLAAVEAAVLKAAEAAAQMLPQNKP